MRKMRFDRILRTFAPIVAMAAAAAGAGCNSASARFNGVEGVPLAELDTSGAAPSQVTLLGPDRVLISEGDTFAITVEGASEHLRFALDDGALGIMRAPGSWSDSSAATTVRVTLPAPPRKLTIAGSGDIVSQRLGDSAEVNIAGSGNIETPRVEADTLDISIAGSGTYRAAGSARRLDLSVAGSGDAELAALRVERADLSIAGSGNAIFASDGEVDASIMGSGHVTVRGEARCTVNSLGSGTLTCERDESPA